MKVLLTVGNENLLLTCSDLLCLKCSKCDLETWERTKWRVGSSPQACKGTGVCSPTVVACTDYEPRGAKNQ